MKQKETLKSSGLTEAQIKLGIHYHPECVFHAEIDLWERQHGTAMSFTHRNSLYNKIYTESSPEDRQRPEQCAICQDVIADAVLNGRDPFEPDNRVIERLRAYGIYFSRRNARKAATPPSG